MVGRKSGGPVEMTPHTGAAASLIKSEEIRFASLMVSNAYGYAVGVITPSYPFFF
jgi:hypothetical protein